MNTFIILNNILNSAVKWLIAINLIQNKCLFT